MHDKPSLEDLVGKNEARRLQAMSKAFGEALDMMFFGGNPMTQFQKRCDECNEIQPNPVATISACNYCREDVCFTCRDTGQHAHDERHESINFGFCLPCGKVQAIESDGKGYIRCVDCHFGWAPRAICGASTENSHQAICPFCGALQETIAFPCHCGRCAQRLF